MDEMADSSLRRPARAPGRHRTAGMRRTVLQTLRTRHAGAPPSAHPLHAGGGPGLHGHLPGLPESFHLPSRGAGGHGKTSAHFPRPPDPGKSAGPSGLPGPADSGGGLFLHALLGKTREKRQKRSYLSRNMRKISSGRMPAARISRRLMLRSLLASLLPEASLTSRWWYHCGTGRPSSAWSVR